MLWQLDPKLFDDNVENWSYLSQAFTKEECEKIIALGTSIAGGPAKVSSPTGKKSAENEEEGEDEGVLQLSERISNVSWITPTEESEWIFRRLTDVVQGANSKFYNFDLWGFAEGLQFTKYEAPDGNYSAHVDKCLHKSTRKLSLVIQLSDPKDYEGGELKIIFSKEPLVTEREQGRATVFPSYTLHQVDPVTKGERYSLVAWITGPNFR
tara:strand:- start:1299 stop:1928 length:630 start_codon:yes stop_codon:yes gene_type:complete